MKKSSWFLGVGAALLLTGSSAFSADKVELKSVPGVRGNAVYLSGHQAFLEDLAGKPFEFKKGFTMSVWLKIDKTGHQAEILSNIGSFQFLKRGISSGGFYFWETGTSNTGSVLWAPDAFPFRKGKWFHVAMTYDQNGNTVGYLNGKRVATQKPGDIKGQGILKIKNRARHKSQHFKVANGSFNGAIDEIYIYGRVLSDAEIADLYAGKAPAGAQGAYLMDDPKQPGLDSSASKRHLSGVLGRLGIKVPVLGSVIDAPAAAVSKDLTAWCRSSVDRVFQLDRLKSTEVKETIVTEMAGNEYESFQSPFRRSLSVRF